jgi:phosphonate transport system permease protein
MTAVVAPSAASLARIEQRAAAERPGWLYYAGWALALFVLAWAWRGAEIRPLDLLRDSGNIGTYASEFFPPDFTDWRIYAHEMVITVHIALWGTVLAVLAAVPMGLLSSANIAPPWLHQPVRRLMDACRAINEMVFAMLFIVAVGLGPWRCTPRARWPSCSPRPWRPSTRARWRASAPPAHTSWSRSSTACCRR